MKQISLILIVLAFLFFMMVVIRNRTTRNAFTKGDDRKNMLMTLLGQNSAEKSDESLNFIILRKINDTLFKIKHVFIADNFYDFVKRLAVPLVFIIAVEAINVNFFHFPSVPIVLVLTPISYIFWYKMLLKKRKKIFEVDFTESISSINGAISSGRTFLQAMDDYSRNNTNKLAKEFGIITRRLNFGDSPEVVFLDSWKVYPYKEYYFFIVAILLNINSGGRLREVLGKLQRSLANNTAMEKKMLTLTSEMRMASKITAAIPFLFLILLKFISEDNFNFIFEDPRGNILLYYLLGSVGVGTLIIKFLMRKI
ncbi:type II secretion system F family protein [Rosenbergiella australiborealis]|uniref:type II secretion system F family protein n=1 Tax=Rosenbergiella australiborealis TaxID=1544696 RepID=UPI001F4E3C50|nr:type II secretion system F family protein [Rosenbergiella australiborealis]